MDDIKDKVTQEDLNRWFLLQRDLAQLVPEEKALRKKIFDALFPEPREGANSTPLTHGWVLKGVHKISRSIDFEALTTLDSELREHGIPVGQLIKYVPELSLKEYRKLNDEQRKEFDQILEIKPGSPHLSIQKPATKGEEGDG